MSEIAFRTLAALLICGLLIVQARRAAGGLRRRAFWLGAAAFGLFALGNVAGALSAAGWLIYLLTLLGIGLVGLSLLTLYQAYRAGEMAEQLRQASDLVDAERRRREAALEAKQGRGGKPGPDA